MDVSKKLYHAKMDANLAFSIAKGILSGVDLVPKDLKKMDGIKHYLESWLVG